jgi:hypothetical protein
MTSPYARLQKQALSGISTAMTCWMCSLTCLAADLGIVKCMGERYNPFDGVSLCSGSEAQTSHVG